jgi:hypothetical protein
MLSRKMLLLLAVLALLADAQSCAGLNCGQCIATAGCSMCSGGCKVNTTSNTFQCTDQVASCLDPTCTSSCGGCTPGCFTSTGNGCGSVGTPSTCCTNAATGNRYGNCPASSTGVQDLNGNLGAGIIILIVFLVLLLVVLPASLAIAYFACGCAICGRSRNAKTVGDGAVLATTASTPTVAPAATTPAATTTV